MIFNRDDLLKRISEEADRAKELYPSNEFLLAAHQEESGEFAQAFIDNEKNRKLPGDILMEGIQVAAVTVRLLEESSKEFTKYPGVYNMNMPEQETLTPDGVKGFSEENKAAVLSAWKQHIENLDLRPGTREYKNAEVSFFQGAIQTLQSLFPNVENPEALSKEVPTWWAIAIMSGRQITD